MNTDKLIMHNFFQQILKDTEPYSNEVKVAEIESMNDSDILEIDYYIRNTAFYATHLFQLCNQLERAIELLSNFTFNSKNGISRGDHLAYNVENYIIRLTSLTDRVLQTINAVYHLGINEKDINDRVVLNNLKVTMTELPKSFNEFRKVLKDYVSERNVIVHRHSYVKEELNRIKIFYNTYLSKKMLESNKGDSLKYVRTQALNHYLTQTKKEFTQTNQMCFEKLLLIFDDLDKQYSLMKQNMKKNH